MSEQPATIKFISIDRMTLDLFQFWLDYDLPSIVAHVHLLSITDPGVKPAKYSTWYIGVRRIFWKEDSESEITHTTTITWAQVRTDTLHVEFTLDGQLPIYISEWLTVRFGVDVPKNAEPKISKTPEAKLTPTEKKVAHLLAQNLDYEQIGVRLGDKSIHAARKHAQSLAKKWNTKQVVEILWSEAKKRGYSTPDTI